MKTFSVTKMDRRHTGSSVFTHYITPIFQSTLADKLQFLAWRKWCWETFGMGMESTWAMELGSDNYEITRWAWMTEHKLKRIYFRSEKELNWFMLKWSSE
jgi:hypothetical protein